MALKILLIGLAGALGTLCRYGLSLLIHQRVASGYYFLETLTVNALGCFLFGLVWSLAENKEWLSEAHKMIVLVGFMGAFTTFSTYIFQSNELLEHGRFAIGAANLLAQNLLGFGALLLGVMLGRI